MNSAARTTSDCQLSGKCAAFECGLNLRIAALLVERDLLQEEVEQLRAAAQLYTEVVRRLQVKNAQRAA
jgi:hypothetical protein